MKTTKRRDLSPRISVARSPGSRARPKTNTPLSGFNAGVKPLILFLYLMIPCSFACEARVFQLTYIKSKELIGTLEKSFASSSPPPGFAETGTDQFVMYGGDAASQQKAEDFLKQVDCPTTHPTTKFVRLRHADPEQTADLIAQVFASPLVCDMPVQAVANPRTKEVFVMGPMREIALAGGLIRLLDDGIPLPGK